MAEHPLPRVAVTFASEILRSEAEALARKLNLPLQTEAAEDFPLLLTVSPQGLALLQTGNQSPGPIFVDFSSGVLNYRRKHGGGRKEALARAVGLKKGLNPFVLDATAGLGRDGFILASLGCKVLLVERSPILAALLSDALKRASNNPELLGIINNLSIMQGNSSQILLQLQEPLPDIVYLDPMYPHRTKSALVKKEMRLLRALVGEDNDAAELLKAALAKAKNRVVVKRPLKAPYVGGVKPNSMISSKKHRFDIYLQKCLK